MVRIGVGRWRLVKVRRRVGDKDVYMKGGGILSPRSLTEQVSEGALGSLLQVFKGPTC